jgi:hypothetical protein
MKQKKPLAIALVGGESTERERRWRQCNCHYEYPLHDEYILIKIILKKLVPSKKFK